MLKIQKNKADDALRIKAKVQQFVQERQLRAEKCSNYSRYGSKYTIGPFPTDMVSGCNKDVATAFESIIESEDEELDRYLNETTVTRSGYTFIYFSFPVMWIRISLMRIRILDRPREKMDPDPTSNQEIHKNFNASKNDLICLV